MTDATLDKLKNVPPPRDEARRAAIDAATRAFAHESSTTETTQGSNEALRLTRSADEKRRAWMPARRTTYAIAASVAVAVVSVPVLLHYLEEAARVPPYGRAEADKQEAQEQSSIVRPASISVRVGMEEKQVADAVAAQQSAAKVAASEPAKPDEEKARAQNQPTQAPARDAVDKLGQASQMRRELQSGLLGGARAVSGVQEQRAAIQPASPMGYAGPTLLSRLDDNRQDRVLAPQAEQGRDRFDATPPNPVKSVAQEPVSTFSIDVDTASYSFVRRALNAGRLPQKDAVRVEEMVNYFSYDYARPENASEPFLPTVTVFPAPWNADNKLVHVAIKGYDIKSAERPRANIVLLIDVSGSMAPADRLPMLRNAFRMLVDELKPDDTVGIVTYAGGTGVALEPTKGSDKGKIIQVIESLQAGGSTAGAAGIQEAYRMAEAGFDKAAVNRIILATDGDFNVGITNRDELKGFVERKRESGIYLSILGVGQGNHNDQLMQALAQNGNGAAAYIDTLSEARKVLIEESSSTLFPIARDVKIQIEFNPARVAEYRLIGYETRALKREDFNNDKVDAGDVGSGHSITAIYEITPVGAPRLVEDLRYGKAAAQPAAAPSGQDGELGFLRLRYKLPKEQASRLLTLAITPALEKRSVAEAPPEVRFSTAVAAFGQLLRGLPYLKSYGYDDVITLASGAKGDDPFGYRSEFVNLVRLAKSARP
jgi:Ca-activated chloride channel family protein